jgi:alpha-1,6-mannosyltransferase
VTFTPSEEVADRLRACGVRRVHVTELGVDTEVFKSTPDDAARTRSEHNLPAEATLLMYVGRLAPEKNTTTLFRAFELLTARSAHKFHLLIVGDGQQRGSVRQLQNSTNAVTWVPYCADAAQLAKLCRAADLFVHPGTQETFGLVALESQACGTPVVGISGSAMDRLILHDQASWASQNSPQALADAVERSLTRDLQALGAGAAAAVSARYSWRRVFDDLFCIYREVCAQYGRPAAV